MFCPTEIPLEIENHILQQIYCTCEALRCRQQLKATNLGHKSNVFLSFAPENFIKHQYFSRFLHSLNVTEQEQDKNEV